MPSAEIKAAAQALGFELVGIAPAVRPVGYDALQDWLTAGYSGEMQYIPRRLDAYAHPEHVLPNVRSVIMLGMNYHVGDVPQITPGTGRVARYAQGTADYHTLIRGRLRELTRFLKAHLPGCKARGIVDTAPLLERDFARRSGMGWFGKNTLLIRKGFGSWFFLAGVLVDQELDYDPPQETSHCGTCTRCLTACPTDAFPAPYVLDATRCISYLTIELRGPIPEELRAGMGNWVFGCDICQDVCPWNRKAPHTQAPAFQPLPEFTPLELLSLLSLTEEQFAARFAETPLARPGRSGILRNAAIVLGNHKDPAALPALQRGCDDSDPVIAEACRWAVQQIAASTTQAVDKSIQ